MSENSARIVNVEKGKQGFQEAAKSESNRAVLGDADLGSPESPDASHTLPNGLVIGLHAVPDREAFEPITKTDDDGNYVTFYVGVTNSGPSNDPVRDHSRILTSMDFQVAGEDDNPRDLVREHAAMTGDLDRAVLLFRTSTDPVQYRGERVGNGFYAEDGDDDDWKRADAAFIISEDHAPPAGSSDSVLDADANGWVEEINQAAHGKSYAAIAHKTSPSGQMLDEMYDDYDETIVNPQDASARAEAYVSGGMGSLSEIF